MGDMLKDRVAVVTGAGNGIGRAEAIGLASQGAAVVVNDLGTSPDGRGTSREPADRTVEEIVKSGGTAVASYDSVATEEGAGKIIRLAVEKFGKIDILINNAGIVRVKPVYEVATEDWDAVIKTHLYGTFFCTRAACIEMKKRGYGRIINTSSHTGLGLRGNAAYSAAKEGITGFSRTVARDMARYGVTCNVLRPIAAWRGATGEIPGEMQKNRPEDIAALAVYLASESADHINGCIFEVWRGHVGIFTDPPPVEQIIETDGGWTPEELSKRLPESLTKGRSREKLPYTMPPVLRNIEQ